MNSVSKNANTVYKYRVHFQSRKSLQLITTVTSKSLDEPLRLFRATSNAPVATNVDGTGQKNAKRVRELAKLA